MLFKQKILFIHKNKKIRNTITTYLRELDYAIILAESPEDMYNMAKSTLPDLILWGSVLTADAKKILRRIKKSTFAKNTPVIAMIGDIELYERIELENNGIHDVISLDPNLAELRLRIKLHLDFRGKSSEQEKQIKRLKSINEINYNISISLDVNTICELFNDFLVQDYNFDFIYQLQHNEKSGDFEYKNLVVIDPDLKQNISALINQPVWKEKYFSGHNIKVEKIADTKIIGALNTAGISSELYYQIPVQAENKTTGIAICGISVKKALSNYELNEIAVLAKAIGHRIAETAKPQNAIPAKENKVEIQNFFQRFKEDEIFEYLSKQVIGKLKTDVSIYLNYNKGFRFLYPQYCFKKGKNKNQFETEKPTVLPAKDYPNFERFIDSKKKSTVFKVEDDNYQDIAKIISLAGNSYNSIVIFSVEIGGEVNGYIITASENSMTRFTNTLITETEHLVQKVTEVLMESRLIKQANQTIKQLDRVFELGKDLTLESHINELLPKIASAIRRTLGWNIIILDRVEPRSRKFKNVCYLGIQEKVFKGITEKYPNTMYSILKDKCFKQSNSYFLDHTYINTIITDEHRREFQLKINKQWSDRDWLFVPIQSRGRELGVIAVNDPVDRLRPNDEKVRSLEYFANQAAVALENDALFQDLKSSETKFRALAETMTMGLVSCTINGEIIYNNPSFAITMQYEVSANLTGKNIYHMCSDKSSLALEKYVLGVTKGSTPTHKKEYEAGLEIELLGNDNVFVPFKIYLTKSFDNTEKGFVGVLADLRPQRRIERLKADFNSMVVHDLRSPLNIIQGYIDIVRNRVVGDISEEQEELLSIAKENCYKILKLIDNFLIASKMEVGSFQITPEVNALNTLVESVAENHQVLAEKKNIKISIKIDHNIPLMAFDKMRIEQVITNYLSNALKFSRTGGIIEVGNKLVNVKNELTGEDQEEIQVWVKDQGVGIAADEQEKVFNKYEQTEAGKDASLKGTGLGLAICKEIVTLHKGKVWVKSVPDKGSTFYFSLPVTTKIRAYSDL
jgi:signal transduction histidine kinase/transcriptional regulator with GAF, ATPase, and Fis domain